GRPRTVAGVNMLNALEYALDTHVRRRCDGGCRLERIDVHIGLLRAVAGGGLPYGETSLRAGVALLSADLAAPVFVEAALNSIDVAHLGFCHGSECVFLPVTDRALLLDPDALSLYDEVRRAGQLGPEEAARLVRAALGAPAGRIEPASGGEATP
ncbi:MAG: hypothetical protein ABIS21_00840, partial [Acidimicrobiales bacterium]